MKTTPTAIPDVVLFQPTRHTDDRGYFVETFRESWLPQIHFVQDNESHSVEQRTLRGLHYQLAPADQAKLVRVARGRIRDIAVDLREGSATYRQHVAVELSAEDGTAVLVPSGFAHGFVTLEPDTLVVYKVSAYYSGHLERGIRWDDETLAIDWGFEGVPVLSDRDASHPPFDPDAPPFRIGDPT